MKRILSATLALLLPFLLPAFSMAEGLGLTSPKTGDTSNILLWAILLGVSAVVVVTAIVLIVRKNRKKR